MRARGVIDWARNAHSLDSGGWFVRIPTNSLHDNDMTNPHLKSEAPSWDSGLAVPASESPSVRGVAGLHGGDRGPVAPAVFKTVCAA